MGVTVTIPTAGDVTGTEPTTATAQPVLELRNVTAGYGDLAAVRDVSLHVNAGEVRCRRAAPDGWPGAVARWA
jgi:hypothetical protein